MRRRTLLPAVLVSNFEKGPCSGTAARSGSTMGRTDIENLAVRWMRFWQGGSLDDFDVVHAETFVDHSSAGRRADRAGLRAAIVELYSAFPDFKATADLVAVNEALGMATIRWSATGRQSGPFLGRAPTNRSVSFQGIEIIHCRGGRIVERWGEWDESALLGQLGPAV